MSPAVTTRPNKEVVRSISLSAASLTCVVNAQPLPLDARCWSGPNLNGTEITNPEVLAEIVWEVSDATKLAASTAGQPPGRAQVSGLAAGSPSIRASHGNGSVFSAFIPVTVPDPNTAVILPATGVQTTAEVGTPTLGRVLQPFGLEIAIQQGLVAAVREMLLSVPQLAAELGIAVTQAVSTGTTYYVSPSGNDANAGTSQGAAWKTLSKVSGFSFAAGSIIALEGGQTFTGTLTLTTGDAGTPSNPITVQSYGTGRATISAGAATAIAITNVGGVIVKDVILVGNGTSNNTHGLNASNNLAGDVLLDFLWLENVEASGFGQYGLTVNGFAGRSGWRNVTIARCSSHDNKLAGINVFAFTGQLYVHQNLTIRDTLAFSNTGVAGTTNNSGSGIVLGGVDGALVEYTRAFSNGAANTSSAGPVGIWSYNSTNVLFQFNESYNNRTSGANDGGGFDFGQYMTNSTMQYNYSHGNDGPGFLLDGYSGKDNVGNKVRYNISENDSRRSLTAGVSTGAIVVFGRVVNAEIYNNTVYITPGSGTTRAIYLWNAGGTLAGSNIKVRNNILVTSGAARLVEILSVYLGVTTGLRFEGNAYYSITAAPVIQWGGTSYTTLAAWRTGTVGSPNGTQERLSGNDVGQYGNPLLTNPSGGGTIGDARQLGTLTAYKLQAGSPCINAGLDLPTLFGLNVGSIDFYQQPIPAASVFDIGAHEWQ